jgi:hypothetical protein
MACAYITDLATSIWKDLGEPSDMSVSYIQTKLVSEYFIGKLNINMPAAYSIVNGDIFPALDNIGQAIYALMYKSEYYANRITKLLSGYSAATTWVELSDGDSKIRRASPTEMAKALKDLKAQIDSDMHNIIHAYRMNSSTARSMDYYTIDGVANTLQLNAYRPQA